MLFYLSQTSCAARDQLQKQKRHLDTAKKNGSEGIPSEPFFPKPELRVLTCQHAIQFNYQNCILLLRALLLFFLPGLFLLVQLLFF